jgi:hypothetical protein
MASQERYKKPLWDFDRNYYELLKGYGEIFMREIIVHKEREKTRPPRDLLRIGSRPRHPHWDEIYL